MYLPSALSLLVLAASASAQDTPQLTLAEDDSWNKSAVLGIPSVVTAGDETVWHMNISNSPKGSFTHHQKMSIYLRSFSRPETADDPTSGWPDLYCHVTNCVLTNLTTFAITIPKAAFPSSARMTTSFQLYDSPTVGYSSWGDDTSYFNLTGGTATLSAWEKKYGFDAPAHWSTRLPCEQVPCARACIEDNLDPDEGPYFQQPGKSKFKRCMAGCGISDLPRDKDAACITTNATDRAETPTGTGPPAEATTGGDADGAAPGRRAVAGGMVVGVLGWLAVWAL